MPLELKKNRILPITVGLQTYTYTVGPITREEWLAYFDSVVVEQKVEDGAIVNVSENDSARLDLLSKLLVAVQGTPPPTISHSPSSRTGRASCR